MFTSLARHAWTVMPGGLECGGGQLYSMLCLAHIYLFWKSATSTNILRLIVEYQTC